MALVIGQIVRVRVALVVDTADNSVGQVFDEVTGQWAELVWIDLATSTAFPMEFGDVEFFAEVASLTLTRSGLTRPAVRLRSWRSGGTKADGYEILVSGSSTSNQAKLQVGGADLATNLPGLGAVTNKVRIRGLSTQRVGWTGRLPAALSWDRSLFALRKRVKYAADATYEQEYLAGIAGFAADLGTLNSWLGANQPEYGAALTIGTALQFSRSTVSGAWTYTYKYTATFTIHCLLAFDASGVAWSARGALLRTQSIDYAATGLCANVGLLTFYGDTYATNAANVATAMGAAHQFGTTSGTFTTPAAGGGTVMASPRGALSSGGPSYGVDLTLTVSPKGRITAVSAAGFTSDGTVESVTAWGACKQEGGMLA